MNSVRRLFGAATALPDFSRGKIRNFPPVTSSIIWPGVSTAESDNLFGHEMTDVLCRMTYGRRETLGIAPFPALRYNKID